MALLPTLIVATALVGGQDVTFDRNVAVPNIPKLRAAATGQKLYDIEFRSCNFLTVSAWLRTNGIRFSFDPTKMPQSRRITLIGKDLSRTEVLDLVAFAFGGTFKEGAKGTEFALLEQSDWASNLACQLGIREERRSGDAQSFSTQDVPFETRVGNELKLLASLSNLQKMSLRERGYLLERELTTYQRSLLDIPEGVSGWTWVLQLFDCEIVIKDF